MSKQLIKNSILGMIVLGLVYLFTACNKENVTTTSADTLTDQSIYSLEQRGNLGKHGCYDLVFPVSIKLTDGTVITAPNQDSLRAAIHRWHQTQNPSNDPQRPDFVYPIQVIAEDGSIINVASKEELLALKAACHKNHLDSLMHRDSLGHHNFPRHDTLCFTLVFPIQVKKSDGTTVTINSFADLKYQAKAEHGKGHGFPGPGHGGLKDLLQIVYPITIKYANGTTKTINSDAELKTAREGC